MEWGGSLLNMAEVIVACLDAVEPGFVLEIGAYRGELTERLLDWTAESGAEVACVEPAPPPALLERAEKYPKLELIRESSHDALRGISAPQAVVLDGDHNYFTLSEELRLIDQLTGSEDLPLMMFHDVGWPLGRRDSYYVPERVPEEHRQPIAAGVDLIPEQLDGESEGLRIVEPVATEEGGPRNGVLTAIEDFIEGRENIRLATTPIFFGFGVLYREDAPWAGAVTEILKPYVGNPILERLETNRVTHLLKRQAYLRELRVLQSRLDEQQHVLRRLRTSSAFALGEKVSRLRNRGRAESWGQQIEHALGENDSAP